MTDYTKENDWVHDMVVACGQNPNSTDINGVALYHIIDLIRQDEREACAVAKPWVGLTDEERNEMRSIVQGHTRIDAPTYGLTLQYATEEVLKEKNNAL